MKIKFYTIGGTIDKVYFDANSTYEIGSPKIQEIIDESNIGFDYSIESILKKDSLDMTDEDREKIHKTISTDSHQYIIITHGTDTMVKTAQKLSNLKNKTIILTGSMLPANFKYSDATFNVGCAVGAVQSMPHGVYIAMNGMVFNPDKVEKNLAVKKFESVD